jgi:hypothetical protein
MEIESSSAPGAPRSGEHGETRQDRESEIKGEDLQFRFDSFPRAQLMRLDNLPRYYVSRTRNNDTADN